MLLRNIKPFNYLSKFNRFRYQTGAAIDTKLDKFSSKPEINLIKKARDYDQNLTNEQKKTMKKFTIFRYEPEDTEGKHYVTYHVDLKECGPMVLDALIKIKDEIDPSLAFRRSCREGICGSCSMNIDGRNTLACLSYIDNDLSRESNINPLPYFLVMRDLIVDMTNFYTQYKSIQPVLMRKTAKPDGLREYYQSEDDRAKLDGLYECILCACCQSNCPSYWWQPGDYYGPAVLMAAYRWIIDSRDEFQEERLEKLTGQKIDKCYQIGACSLTCPKGLDPRFAIEKLKDLFSEYKRKKQSYIAI